jgi:hypothetical protein
MTTTLNRSFDLLARLLGGQVKLIAGLQVHPEGSLNIKPLFQAQGGIGWHRPFAADELINPIGRHMQLPSWFRYRHVQLLQLIHPNRVGMNGMGRAFFCSVHGGYACVIINAKTRYLISCIDQLCFTPESRRVPIQGSGNPPENFNPSEPLKAA